MNSIMRGLNIHVSGVGPKHIKPIDSFKPYHQAYPSSTRPNPTPIESIIRASLPGGSIRMIKTDATCDGTAIIYDRDVVTTWRLPNTLTAYDVFFLEKAFEAALGQETMVVAIEAFLDADDYCQSQLLRDFGDFVAELGTQPVTLRISDLVEHMQESYWKASPCDRWSVDVLEKYVVFQDCWVQNPGRAPAVEATFTVLNWGIDELDIEITYTTSLPKLQFENLRNVVATGDVFDLRPSISCGANRTARDEQSVEYFVGGEWLGWDCATWSFRGKVPDEAAMVGAERMDAYTLPLEMLATITHYFPRNIRLERIIRVALPLTVKRRPNCCNNGTNPFPRMQSGSCRPDVLTRPILMRTRQSGTENHPPSMDEVSKLLEHKAAAPRPSSPLRLNSLTLARLHDAVMLSAPPPSLTDVEVRTVQYSPQPENETHMPETPTRCYSCASQGRQPAATRRTDSGRCLDCEAHRDDAVAKQRASTTLVANDDLGEEGEDRVDLWQAEIQENYRQFEQARIGEGQSDKQA